MAFKITLDSFLAVIKRSALLSEEQVDSALEKFRASEDAVDEAKPFASYLVKNKLLTVWQAEKVLQGKHKGFVLGRYRLLSLLGKGGMSSVYLAEHMVMKRHCALKVLPAKRVNDASYLGRFHREAQAVASLDHPNIVRAYDVDMATDGGVEIHFLAMEFVKGKSLLELVQEKGPVDIADAAEIIRQSALGLDHAHRAGLVHRDVKPGNLLVTSDGIIKVLDLGLARFFDDEGDHSLTVQHDERVLGTADYISPEQAIDSHKVDARTDIYSLGCTFYFLLAGHPPFNSGSLAQRLVAHQTLPPPPITRIRPRKSRVAIQAIIEKMMAKKVEERYQSAQEVVEALAAWLANPTESPAPDVEPPATAVVIPPVIPHSDYEVSLAASSSVKLTGRASTGTAASKPVATGKENATSTTAAAVEGGDSPEPGSDVALNPTGAKGPRKPGKKGTPASVDTNKGTGKGSDVDLLDQVFNPSLLDLENIEYVDESGESDSQLNAQWRGSLPKSGFKRTKKKKKTFGSKVSKFFSDIPVIGWVVFVVLAGLLVAAGWLILETVPTLPTIATDADPVIAPTPSTPVSPTPVTSTTDPAVPTTPTVPTPTPAPETPAPTTPAPTTPTPAPTPAPTPTPTPTPAPETPAADPSIIDVGPTGKYKTIREAISFVRASFHPVGDQDTRTIQVAGDATYVESIQIHGGASQPFPKNVIIKSVGSKPAVIQGVGGQPVLDIQEVESLTVSGFTLDAQIAKTAVRLAGQAPGVRLDSLSIRSFAGTGVLLDNVSGKAGMECQLSGLEIRGSNSEAAGILCQPSSSGNTSYIQITNLHVVGPLYSGVEIMGMFSNSSITDSIFFKCGAGVRSQGGTLLSVSLVNNTFLRNQRAIVFARVPDNGSREVRVLHNLFQKNIQADAVLESGDVAALSSMLFSPTEGLHHNWTNRKESETQEIDLFSVDGRRSAIVNFVSDKLDHAAFMKPSNSELNIASPAPGAKGYVGAVAP